MTPRPSSLGDVAERSESLADFGRHLRVWLHELRRVTSRPQIAAAIADEPRRLGTRFDRGYVADAWLAAYGEYVAEKVGIAAPHWVSAPWRISRVPIFDEGATPALRTIARLNAPLAFKRRNVFTPSVDLPLSLRPGRPTKSLEEKRKTNAERQRRFREARARELKELRQLARR